MPECLLGDYCLIRKGEEAPASAQVYRRSHPLGEHVLDAGRRLEIPAARTRPRALGLP